MTEHLRFATWNVNSVRKRADQIIDWLRTADVDVLCLQETKCMDDVFPVMPFEELGYTPLIYGQKAYNGVAIITRREPADVERGMPGYDDPACRVIGATVGGVRVVSAYVPNGQHLKSEKYAYKMKWLARFLEYARRIVSAHPRALLMGDYNIAPADIDLHDPDGWRDEILTTPREREAYRKLEEIGLQDLYRKLHPSEHGFTWWDYRQGGFENNRGFRIDFAMATSGAADRVRDCHVDEGPRGNDSPSDHTPLVVSMERS